MIGSADYGFYSYQSDSNTVTQSYVWGGQRGVWWDTGSDRNSVVGSSVVGNSQYGLYVVDADTNVVTQSLLYGGQRAVFYNTGADWNAVSLSTMVSDSAGNAALYIFGASSNTFSASYVQGSTAALLSGSTGTVFSGTILVATNTAGAAVALVNGSVNLTIATSTLAGRSRGLGLNPGNAGVVSLGSVTFTSAARAIEFSTQAAGFTLAVDSITFRASPPARRPFISPAAHSSRR